MKNINVRIFHGGFFVTKEQSIMYEVGGIKLVTNVDEIAYFEIVDWIKTKLNGIIFRNTNCSFFFRNTNCSLFKGGKEIIVDSQLTNFLKSLEKDGWHNLYVVHGGTNLGEKELVNVEVNNVESVVSLVEKTSFAAVFKPLYAAV